ncbi:MAG: serine protease [Alphaproteobacteria bacterium]|nr:serine protease [Alphaproteobacteria bacterium]
MVLGCGSVGRRLKSGWSWRNGTPSRRSLPIKRGASLKSIRQQFSASELARGDALVREWRPKPETNPRDWDAPPQPGGSGTGFFISALGHIVTNAHVVPACCEVRITRPAQTMVQAKVPARDAINDLALLKCEGAPPGVAVFLGGRGVRPGDNVLAVGFPLPQLLSSDTKETSGSISSLAGGRDDARFFQISAPVQPGNSTGLLVDLAGNIVGVVTRKRDVLLIADLTGDVAQNVNYALKA